MSQCKWEEPVINVCGCCKISGIFPPSDFAAKNSGLLIAAIKDAWLDGEGCVTITFAKVGCKSQDVIIKSILSAELLKDPNLLEELCVSLVYMS